MWVCKARQVLIDLRKDFLEFLGSLAYPVKQAFLEYLEDQGTRVTHCQTHKRGK